MLHVLSNQPEIETQGPHGDYGAVDLVGNGYTVCNVLAMYEGTVITVVSHFQVKDRNSKGDATYGNYIKIRHDNGMVTLYAHLKYGTIRVKVGDRVSTGQVIAGMGDTGNSTAYHLHLEVRDANGQGLYPWDYLKGVKTMGNTSSKTYTVKAGDTLAKIGRELGVAWELLYEHNKNIIGPKADLIIPGQVLNIPQPKDPKDVKIEELQKHIIMLEEKILKAKQALN